VRRLDARRPQDGDPRDDPPHSTALHRPEHGGTGDADPRQLVRPGLHRLRPQGGARDPARTARPVQRSARRPRPQPSAGLPPDRGNEAPGLRPAARWPDLAAHGLPGAAGPRRPAAAWLHQHGLDGARDQRRGGRQPLPRALRETRQLIEQNLAEAR